MFGARTRFESYCGPAVIRVERFISYISVAIVLTFGVLIVSGVFGFLDPAYRIGFGIVIILYSGVRLLMLYSADRREGKKS